MGTYSRYNQIPMYEPDEEHISFITDRCLYCYKAMPFGLKNARATYQRLLNRMFKDLIGKSIEVYVDDILVKSKTTGDHIEHLYQMFNILQKYLKCAFGVKSSKFLGFMVNQSEIEVDPENINALLEISHPRKPKEVTNLTGRVAASSHFVS